MRATESLIGPHEEELTKIISLAEKTGSRDKRSWGDVNRSEHVPEEQIPSKRRRTEVSTLVEEETQTTNIQQLLYPSRTEPHKTNYVLDVARFGSHEKNLLFFVYGKEIVKKAIELYFGTPRNVHKEKALASGDPRNFQGGLVATMESIRTGGDYRHTEAEILKGVDIYKQMVSKYESLKEPKMSLRKDLDLERYGALMYLVNTYILRKETNTPKALNLSFKPV